MIRPRIAITLNAFLLLSALCSSGLTADKPNIIIFLADDLGYADIGINGCKDIPTPNIDSIRSQPSSRTSTRMATASQREKKSRRISLAVVTRKCLSHELFLR